MRVVDAASIAVEALVALQRSATDFLPQRRRG
jgi:hypothetical protein